MAEQSRIRISLTAGELEVEGTEAFVAQYADAIEGLIGRLETQPLPTATSQPVAGPASAAGTSKSMPTELPEFGELLHGLPSNVSGPDRIVVAGWYVQQTNSENTFSTGEANQLLIGQGIKLSNPSQALKNAIAAKRVFKVGNRYRVSKAGEDHIKPFLGQ